MRAEPSAQGAFRAAAAELPNPLRTAELLIAQLGQQSNAVQLWLWREICALPLDLPVSFIELFSDIERDESSTVAAKLSDYSLPHALAYLARLTQYDDRGLRRSALWALGELMYLPAAILLLDYLESAERDDLGDVLSALMNFAYSEILVRVLRWSQGNPWHRDTVIAALARRKRGVTSRLLSFADSRRLTLTLTSMNWSPILTSETLPWAWRRSWASKSTCQNRWRRPCCRPGDAEALRRRIAGAITHLPNREGFQQLAQDIEQCCSILRKRP